MASISLNLDGIQDVTRMTPPQNLMMISLRRNDETGYTGFPDSDTLYLHGTPEQLERLAMAMLNALPAGYWVESLVRHAETQRLDSIEAKPLELLP